MSQSSETITVTIDGASVQFAPGVLFSEASDAIKSKIAPERVITEVHIDGQFVDMEQELKMAAVPVGQLGELKFQSKEVGALIKESLEMAPQICAALPQECKDIDDLFEANKLTEAHERVGELSALMDWLLQLITSLQSYGENDFRTMAMKTGTPIDTVRRMETLLGKLHQCLIAKNYPSF